MTAKQKADKARAEASLELLKQQGLIKIGSEERDESSEQDKADSKELDDLPEDPVEDQVSDEEKDEEQEGEEDEESDVSDESEVTVDNWEEIETKADLRKKNRQQAILENISNKEANLKNQVNNGRKESDTNNQAAAKAANQQPTLTVKVNTKHIKSSALQQQQEEDTLLRSPIVCVLGHVDTGSYCSDDPGDPDDHRLSPTTTPN